MSQPKFRNEPLGALKNLNFIIDNFSTEQNEQETRELTIIYAKRKLQVQIPVSWTINKVKCMMCIHFETLNFDKFQFQCNKYLIPGKVQVAQLPDEKLIVTQAECPNAFLKYYKKSMKKVVQKYQITTENTLYPITHRSLSHAMVTNIPTERLRNIQDIPQNRRRQQPQGMMVMNILRIIGIAFMSNLIFTFASFSQIAILVGVAIVYYLIDEYVKYNDRRRRDQERLAQLQQADRRRQEANRANLNQNGNLQNKQQTAPKYQSEPKQQDNKQKYFNEKQFASNQEQAHLIQQKQKLKDENAKQLQNQKPKRKIIKAKIYYWMAFLVELAYCYILSIFPNWTVETHLHANQEKLNRVLDKVKNLDPQATEIIKKWEIKQNIIDQKGNQQKIKKQ